MTLLQLIVIITLFVMTIKYLPFVSLDAYMRLRELLDQLEDWTKK